MISAIAAVDRNFVIGKGNDLPWDYPEDMRHFQKITSYHTLIMGRSTWESIGCALKNRRILILSKTLNPRNLPENVYSYVTPGEILSEALHWDRNPVVCGGAQIYELFMPFVDKLYLTCIDVEVETADTWFPALDSSQWNATHSYTGSSIDVEFKTFERVT